MQGQDYCLLLISYCLALILLGNYNYPSYTREAPPWAQDPLHSFTLRIEDNLYRSRACHPSAHPPLKSFSLECRRLTNKSASWRFMSFCNEEVDEGGDSKRKLVEDRLLLPCPQEAAFREGGATNLLASEE